MRQVLVTKPGFCVTKLFVLSPSNRVWCVLINKLLILMGTVGHLKLYFHIDQDLIYEHMPVGAFSVPLITFPMYVAADPQEIKYFHISFGSMRAILI